MNKMDGSFRLLVVLGVLLFLGPDAVLSLSMILLRTRTGNLWRKISLARLAPPTSTTSQPQPQEESSSSSPMGYNQVFGTPSQPYVPDGLSAAEYTALQQKEAADKASKNYGAWGPRFRRDARAPAGDWFVMPALWTSGNPNAWNDNNKNNNNNNNHHPSRRRRHRWSTWLAAWSLACMVVHVLGAAVHVTQMVVGPRQAVSKAALTTLLVVLVGQHHAQRWLLAAAALVVVPVHRTMNRVMARNQWGSWRVGLLWTLASLLGLIAYTLSLVGVRRLLLMG